MTHRCAQSQPVAMGQCNSAYMSSYMLPLVGHGTLLLCSYWYNPLRSHQQSTMLSNSAMQPRTMSINTSQRRPWLDFCRTTIRRVSGLLYYYFTMLSRKYKLQLHTIVDTHRCITRVPHCNVRTTSLSMTNNHSLCSRQTTRQVAMPITVLLNSLCLRCSPMRIQPVSHA